MRDEVAVSTSNRHGSPIVCNFYRTTTLDKSSSATTSFNFHLATIAEWPLTRERRAY
jgi:hypothetical protein